MGWLRHLHRASGPCCFGVHFPHLGASPVVYRCGEESGSEEAADASPWADGEWGGKPKSPGQSLATAQRRGKGSVTGRDGLIHPFAA